MGATGPGPIVATLGDDDGGPRGARFEIKVDGVALTQHDVREMAVEAARFLQQRNPVAKIVGTDVRNGSDVPFGRAT